MPNENASVRDVRDGAECYINKWQLIKTKLIKFSRKGKSVRAPGPRKVFTQKFPFARAREVRKKENRHSTANLSSQKVISYARRGPKLLVAKISLPTSGLHTQKKKFVRTPGPETLSGEIFTSNVKGDYTPRKKLCTHTGAQNS